METNLLKKHAKSFYWASFFLSREVLKKSVILYNFCRTLDDIVDERNVLEVKKTNFQKFKKNFLNKDFNDPIIKDMWSIINSENISHKIVVDLFDGVETDLEKKVQINTKKDLLVYSYRVAGTVGLMMSKILKVKNKEALRGAIDLGIAMQLTNIARDVYEDSKMKRIYLPANWIPDISLKNLTDLHNKDSEKDERISNAIHEVIGLSDKFYENGFAGLKYIPLSTRLGIFIAANIYRGIGIKIKSNKKKYLRERVYLNLLEKSLITVKSILLFIFIPFMKYQYQKIRDNLPNENL